VRVQASERGFVFRTQAVVKVGHGLLAARSEGST
jgi:hypothetical protein